MKKKRLMIITHDLAIGGLQQVVVTLCKNIDKKKFFVSVLCLREKGEFTNEIEKLDIKVIKLQRKEKGTDYFAFLKVAKILRENKIEIIHTHNSEPFVDGIVASILSNVKTIVHTDHGREFPDKLKYMIHEWIVSHFAYKIVGVSEKTTKNLINYEKISPKKTLTITNGIDLAKYSIDINIDKKRKELGVLKDGPVIGLCTRIVKVKGITYLLQAMTEIIKQFKDVSLIIVGEGPMIDELKCEANSYRIQDSVLFVGARLDIPEILKVFDVYVLSSISEGLPMILLEAMAAGTPIVSTDVGGIPSILTHGKNGSLIKSENPVQIACEVLKLLHNKELRQMYASNSMDLVQKEFSALAMAQKYEALYLRKNKHSESQQWR